MPAGAPRPIQGSLAKTAPTGTPASQGVISVLIAEDHAVVRQGLQLLLDAEADLRIVGEAENGRQAVELALRLEPDVVVMDVAMPLLNGLEATRQITGALPRTRVLLLSAHAEKIYIDQAQAHGAAGYLLKQASSDVLSRAIRAVRSGCPFFVPAGFSAGRASEAGNGNGAGRSHGLTAREVEVLQLVAEGMANKGIASELGISIKTVEKHRQSLMEKLGIHDTAGLTRYALSAGIIEGGLGAPS